MGRGLQASTEPKFLVDVNVGRLAKWLRVLGYDAIFVPDVGDGGLIQIAQRDRRILLTKDGHLLERRLFTSGQLKALRVCGDHFVDQVRQVVTELGLDATKEFSRCIDCNTPLEEIAKEDVREHVPAFVFQTQAEFKQCPVCRKVYWRGTHWQNMRRELARALNGEL